MIVGIDLGTTNCTLSTEEGPLSIEQQLDQNLSGSQMTLPSFCFLPPDGGDLVIGQFAKEQSEKIPDRVIHSAKSWLSYEGVDRRAGLLPPGECETKISPVEVCSKYLSHLNQHFKDVESLVVTVPASFDPSARQLVEEACDQAHLPSRILLEEPLAAFYAWLQKHNNQWREMLSVGDCVLVVDIGGGTTDFSLIRVCDSEGNIELERVAVGDHLLLGGDNMDLALAYHVGADHDLDEWQMSVLIHGCRKAKEALLSDQGPSSVEVVIPGRGSSLIGGSLTLTVSKEQVEQLIVEGFFPKVDFGCPINEAPTSGLSQDALPYAKEARITAHLSHFLPELPTAVLFNGGVMHADAIRSRLLEQLTLWKGEPVKELAGADYDLAVSLGAVAYAKLRRDGGLRVKAAMPHSYFIGVEKAMPAIPGLSPQIEGVCVVPKGMEEGSEVALEQTFSLYVGEPVQFRFFSSHEECVVGEKSPIKKLHELHPIETTLDGEGAVRVKVVAQITELGMLRLLCVSEHQKWELEFLLREQQQLASSSTTS